MKRIKGSLIDKRRTIWEKFFFKWMFAVLLIWSVIIIGMLAWALISSLKTNLEYVNEPLGLPKVLRFDNFKLALEKFTHNSVGFVGMLYNSVWQTVLPSLISTLMHVITGYIFAQYEFKAKNFIFSVVVFVMIIPIYGSFAANYKLNYDLGLNDSYLFLIRSFSKNKKIIRSFFS